MSDSPWTKMSKQPEDGDAVLKEMLDAYASAYPRQINSAANAAYAPYTPIPNYPARIRVGNGVNEDGAYNGYGDEMSPSFQAHRDLDALFSNPPVNRKR